jgi:hypothetical protein
VDDSSDLRETGLDDVAQLLLGPQLIEEGLFELMEQEAHAGFGIVVL